MSSPPGAQDGAPELTTERLVLRRPALTDFADSVALWTDPDVVRFIGGRPFTSEETWARLLRYVGHWSVMDYGFWVIRERAGGRFVGEIGFANFRRELEPSFGEAPEVGWALRPWAHGRGMASEALRAVLEWGEARFGSDARTVCMIDPMNTPSVRLAERHGYRPFARGRHRGSETVLFERGPTPTES
jgi:RimJ/RimL family protein N-acetyltransferase